MSHKLSLKELIYNDMKVALKKKDKLRLSTLRMFLAAIKNKEISKKEELTEGEILSIISGYLKKVEESLEMFTKGQRLDMSEKARQEIKIIKDYLPEQLSEEEITKIIKDVFEKNAFEGLKDIGRAMKEVMPQLKGKADGRLVNKKVKELLINLNN
ncbi:MAG: GatB/YqeY domain-containing protein [Candidatus Caldatribacteriota bacterium]|nr:GatB/YqeY domain-containing protein [Candidatus Caldatribacteriota bacterium]